jgi:CRISPR-associated protein Cmr5
MNIQQQYMKQALDHVTPLVNADDELKTAYGALCHQIPILVLTNGLSLTASFIDAKAGETSARARAFKLAQEHLIATLDHAGATPDLAALLAQRQGAGLHMLDTMTIIDAWAYYKRFAVSLLGVQAGEDESESELELPAADEAAQP